MHKNILVVNTYNVYWLKYNKYIFTKTEYVAQNIASEEK